MQKELKLMKVIVQEDVSPLIKASLSSHNKFGMFYMFFSRLHPDSSAYTEWNLLSFCET